MDKHSNQIHVVAFKRVCQASLTGLVPTLSYTCVEAVKVDDVEVGEKRRKCSMSLYQSVDEDHPDLQVMKMMIMMMMMIITIICRASRAWWPT